MLDPPVGEKDKEEAIVGVPFPGVAEVKIALAIEDSKVRCPETDAAGSLPGAQDFARPVKMNQRAELEIADVKFLPSRKREPKVEAAKGSDELNSSL